MMRALILGVLTCVLWPVASASEPLPVPPYYPSNARIKVLYDTHVAQCAEIVQLRAEIVRQQAELETVREQLVAAQASPVEREILAQIEALRAALPLVLTLQGGGGVFTLTWRDNSSDEQGFRIERAVGGGAWVQVAQVGANVTTYRDTGLAAGSYSYRVRAYNATGNSGYSNTASGTL